MPRTGSGRSRRRRGFLAGTSGWGYRGPVPPPHWDRVHSPPCRPGTRSHPLYLHPPGLPRAPCNLHEDQRLREFAYDSNSLETHPRMTSATSALLMSGSDSFLPSANNSVTRFVSTAKPASFSEMSFAAMKSSPLDSNLWAAFSNKSRDSAANPTTTRGHSFPDLFSATVL